MDDFRKIKELAELQLGRLGSAQKAAEVQADALYDEGNYTAAADTLEQAAEYSRRKNNIIAEYNQGLARLNQPAPEVSPQVKAARQIYELPPEDLLALYNTSKYAKLGGKPLDWSDKNIQRGFQHVADLKKNNVNQG